MKIFLIKSDTPIFSDIVCLHFVIGCLTRAMACTEEEEEEGIEFERTRRSQRVRISDRTR